MLHVPASSDPPVSAWTPAAESLPVTRPLEADRRADVVIVGAGYTGLSAALHLAERGAEVVVLDAAEPGWGGSGRNGGQVIPGVKDDPDELERKFGSAMGRRMWQNSGAAADFVFELIARHKISCHAHQSGWIISAPHAAGLETLRRRTVEWQRRDAPVARGGEAAGPAWRPSGVGPAPHPLLLPSRSGRAPPHGRARAPQRHRRSGSLRAAGVGGGSLLPADRHAGVGASLERSRGSHRRSSAAHARADPRCAYRPRLQRARRGHGHGDGQDARGSRARRLARPGGLAGDADHPRAPSRLAATRHVAGRPLEAFPGLGRHAAPRLTAEMRACYL